MQYRPGENSHEVKKVFYSPFDRRMHTESARECSQRISKADLPGENFPVQNCWKQLGEEVGCTDHCHEHLLSASLDEIRGFRQIFGRSSDLGPCGSEVEWHLSILGRHKLYSAVRPEVLLRTPRSRTGVFQWTWALEKKIITICSLFGLQTLVPIQL